MEFLRVLVLGPVAAATYSVLHNQIAIRVCSEYFTIGQPEFLASGQSTWPALAWGVSAACWFGFPLGFLLASACRAGAWPKLPARRMILPLLALVVLTGASALLSGYRGFVQAERGRRPLPERLANTVPVAKHAAFVADWQAQLAGDAVGTLGGFGLFFGCLHWRWREQIRGPGLVTSTG